MYSPDSFPGAEAFSSLFDPLQKYRAGIDGKASAAESVERVNQHIQQRHTIIQKIGKSASGVVWKALDKVTHQPVALKKIFVAFRNSMDTQRTYREISFLQPMQRNPHVAELVPVHEAINNLDLSVVLEIRESDVHSVIRAGILANACSDKKLSGNIQILEDIRVLRGRARRGLARLEDPY
jgi:serine/threonine protein kinase